MSLLHNRKRPEYGFILALICMALALVAAKYSRQQPSAVENPDIAPQVIKTALPG